VSAQGVNLREITADTLLPILELEVAENQRKFVASNAKSIAQAHYSQAVWFRGIYAGDTPVGFVMLYENTTKPEYVMWRFMIGTEHQGQGHGKRALELVIDHTRTLPGATELCLSYVPGEGEPRPFYEQLGFAETGEEEDGERVMKLLL
jgi:diamine N-acetyltransferase